MSDEQPMAPSVMPIPAAAYPTMIEMLALRSELAAMQQRAAAETTSPAPTA